PYKCLERHALQLAIHWRLSDLCRAAVNEEFGAGHEAAVVRGKENRGPRDLVRRAEAAKRHTGNKTRLKLLAYSLGLRQAVKAWCVDRSWTASVPADLSLLQVKNPGASERPHGGLGSAVDAERRISGRCHDRGVEDDRSAVRNQRQGLLHRK